MSTKKLKFFVGMQRAAQNTENNSLWHFASLDSGLGIYSFKQPTIIVVQATICHIFIAQKDIAITIYLQNILQLKCTLHFLDLVVKKTPKKTEDYIFNFLLLHI